MTDLLSRPANRTRRDAPAEAGRPLPLVGASLAGWAVAIGLTFAIVVGLLGWAADPRSGSSVGAALRLSIDGWLLAHRTGLAVPGGTVGLPPLGLTLALAALLVRTGRVLARTGAVDGAVRAALAVTALAVPYALMATLLAHAGRTGAVHPVGWQATLGGLLLAAGCGGLGVIRETGLAVFPGAGPAWLRPVVLGGAAGAGVLVGGGALVVVLSTAWHLGRADALAASMHPGLVGSVLLAAFCVALVPNAAVSAAAFATGPGFAVGSGTAIAPVGVHVGAVPALPLLAALPGAGPLPAAAFLAFAVPIAAGVVAALVVARLEGGPATLETVAMALATGLVTGLAMTAVGALAGGPAGPGALGTVGPSAWRLGLASAVEVGLVATAVAASRAAWGRGEV